MNFTSAFRALGYEVASPRRDWSAENAGGVCMTFWQSEIGWEGGLPWVDTRIHAQSNELWLRKPGNTKRIRHLKRALNEHDGFVDAVIVQGVPGSGVKDAVPWERAKRKARWKILDLDETTGHFRAVVQKD